MSKQVKVTISFRPVVGEATVVPLDVVRALHFATGKMLEEWKSEGNSPFYITGGRDPRIREHKTPSILEWKVEGVSWQS